MSQASVIELATCMGTENTTISTLSLSLEDLEASSGRVGSYPPWHHVSKALYTYMMPACHGVECRALSFKLSVPIQAMHSYQRTVRKAIIALLILKIFNLREQVRMCSPLAFGEQQFT